MAKQAKVRELENQFFGKTGEPSFTGHKIELVGALNYYSANSKPEDQKEWAIQYCKAHYPQGLEHVHRAAKTRIGTFGSLSRIHARGFELPAEIIQRMHTFFDSLEANEDHYDADGVPVIKAPKPKARVVHYINPAMRNLDDNMELALAGDSYKIAMGDGDVTPVIAYCEHELAVMSEEPDAYFPKTRRVLKKLFNETLEACKTAVVAAKQARIRKVTKRAVPPQKQVAKVKYLREDSNSGLKSLNPQAVLGRSKMYVFDTTRRRFMCFVSTGDGFAFKGTTVCNVDLSKSSFKRVRKPERFFKDLGGTNVAALNKGFAAINGKESPLVTTRLNPNCIIIEVTNY